MTKPKTRDDAIYALAASWASIDGKLEQFAAGRDKSVFDDETGHFAGYTEEASEMLVRLERRGFTIVPLSDSGLGHGS